MVRITIAEASSSTVAAQGLGESRFLRSGISDRRWTVSAMKPLAFPKLGDVWMRKNTVELPIKVGRQDRDDQKAIEIGKQLAKKAAARVKLVLVDNSA